MSSEVGSGHIAIVPQMKGFKRTTRREIQAAGKEGGRGFERALQRAGRDGGASAGTGFRAMFSRGIRDSVNQATKELTQGVARAASAVSKARLSEADAAGSVRVAEAALAEARQKHASDSSQVIRAEERLATVTRRLGAAQDVTRAASERLATAQAALKTATERAARGMGFKQAARDMMGLLAPVRLVGRTLTGPLVKGAKTFADGWSNVARTGGSALFRLGQNTRVLSAQILGVGATVGSKLASPFVAAWRTVSTGAQAVAGRVRGVFAPAARWFSPMTAALGTAVSSAGRLLGGLGGIAGRAVKGMQSAWSTGMAGLSRITSSAMSAVGNVVTGAAVTIGAGITAALGASLAGGWSRMTSIDNAQAKLEGLGHSTEAVADIMDSALKSVEGTAFGLGDAAGIAASAVAAGIKPGEELTKYLSTTAAAAAAAGVPLAEMGSILNRVTTNGKAYTEELNQLSDRGLPIWQALADEMKVPQDQLKEMVAEGKVDAATYMRAVESMSGSVATSMGQTVSGTFANMRTAFSKLGATILTPFKDTFKGLFTTVKAGVDAINTAIAPVVAVVADKVNGVLLPAFERMQAVFANGFSIDLSGLTSSLGVLAPVIGLVAGALGPLLARLPLIGGAFAGLTGPVGLLVGGLVALFAVEPEVLADGFATVIPQIVSVLQGLVARVIQVGAEMLPGMVQALGTGLPILLAGLADIIRALIDGIVQLVPTLVTVLTTVLAAMLVGLITEIVGLLPDLILGALALFSGIATGLVQAIPLILQAIIGMLPHVLSTLIGLVPALILGAMELFLGLVLGLVEAIPAIVQAVVDLIPVLVTALIDMIPQLIEGAIQLFLGLVLGLAEALPEILVAVVGMIPQIITALIGMIPDLITGAIDLFVGMVTGLVGALPEILEALFVELPKALIDGIMALGPALLQAGKDLMGSFAQGFADSVGAVGDALGGAMDWIGGFFPHSPAKRGPFSGPGWSQIAKSGAAISDQFADGLSNARSVVRMPTPVAGAAGSGALASAAAGVQITQENHIAHLDPDVAVESTGQKLASLARRFGS